MLAGPEPTRAHARRRCACSPSAGMVAKKGFDVLVDACAVLRRRGVAFEAAIVGQEDKHSRRGRASGSRAHGLERRVRLPGPMGQDELLREYRRASALCMPSRLLADDRDGIPNVLVEAMAAGTPVIASAVSGIPELVEHEVNGLLVAPEDPEALADALLRLHGDPALSPALARSGPRDRREPLRRPAAGEPARRAVPGGGARDERRRPPPAPGALRDRARAPQPRGRRRRARRALHASRARRATLGTDPDWLGARPAGGRGVADRVGEVRLGARPRPRRRGDRRPAYQTRGSG